MTSNGKRHVVAQWIPGLALCAGVTLVAVLVDRAVPLASALVVAIVIGAIIGNVVTLPHALGLGLNLAPKELLRVGIVLLGLQVSLTDIAALGWPTLVLVVVVVAGGVLSALALGRMLGIGFRLSALVGCGFSICGAAAVAGVEDTIGAKKEETATALGRVVVFGTLSIPIVPALASLMGLDAVQSGVWAGASVHEVAQVVAAAAAMGDEALRVGVIVKLARVVCLAGVMAGFGWYMRRSSQQTGGSRPTLVPMFVVGFLVAVMFSTAFPLPVSVASAAKLIQTICLTMAMTALGCGINIRRMLGYGARPILLGAIVTVVVSALSLGGVLLIG